MTPQARTSVLAVFDFDRTLIDCSSLHPFLRRLEGQASLSRRAVEAGVGTFPRWSRARFKARYVGSVLRNRRSSEVDELAQQFASELVDHHLDSDMVQTLQRHQKLADTTMVLSASLDAYLRPFVAELGVDELLCTEVVSQHGRCTGELRNTGLYGSGKVEALRGWLDSRGAANWRVVAYGNAWQDRRLLRYADDSSSSQ